MIDARTSLVLQLGQRSGAHGAAVVHELAESSGEDGSRQSVRVIDAMEYRKVTFHFLPCVGDPDVLPDPRHPDRFA